MRVVIAEDSTIVREGLVHLLRDAGLDVVAAVTDANAMIEAVDAHLPDVVITDVRMPPGQLDEGLRAAVEIRRKHPDVGILVLSHYVESRQALRLLEQGDRGVGYLLKDRIAEVGELIAALQRVAEGGSVIDPEIVARLVARPRADDALSRLSPREREILALMAEGLSNSALCERLFLSPKTIERHISSIFAKLDLPPSNDEHRRVAAVLRYLRGERPDSEVGGPADGSPSTSGVGA